MAHSLTWLRRSVHVGTEEIAPPGAQNETPSWPLRVGPREDHVKLISGKELRSEYWSCIIPLDTYAPTERSQSLQDDAGAPTVESAGPALPAEVTKMTPWS